MPQSAPKDIKSQIIQLHLKGLRPCQILRRLSDFNLNRMFIYRALKQFKDSGGPKEGKKNGHPRTTRTKAAIKRVRDRLRRKRRQSIRKMAKHLKIHRSSLQRIVKEDLGLKAYKRHKIHALTHAQRVKRVQRAKINLAWRAGVEIIFSDEKLFVLEETYNAQNDRIYAASLQDIPEDELHVYRSQSALSVMVWGAVSKRGKLPLVFIDKGVKINQKYYIEEVLMKSLLPNAKEIYNDDYFCFQQDGAPAHTGNQCQRWCEENLPDFIPKDEWPPSSPDANPLDFSIWSYMLQQINIKNIKTADQFKNHLTKIWDNIPMEVVRAACDDFEPRLRLIIKAKGGHIEHLLRRRNLKK